MIKIRSPGCRLACDKRSTRIAKNLMMGVLNILLTIPMCSHNYGYVISVLLTSFAFCAGLTALVTQREVLVFQNSFRARVGLFGCQRLLIKL